MQINLTKENLITIGITVVAMSLFIAWGIYLMIDKPAEIPPYENPVVITGTTTERYRQIFEIPLDPNLYPDEHKAVYEKIAKYMPFEVRYPTQMPEGYYLTQATTHATYANLLENNLYSVTYINAETKKLISIEGKEGGSFPQGHEEMILSKTKKGMFLEAIEGPITLYVYNTTPPQEGGIIYRVLSNEPNTTKEELIEIGKYLESL